jgi:hypothetical protein
VWSAFDPILAAASAHKQVTFALLREEDDVEKVTATVDALFILLRKSFKP